MKDILIVGAGGFGREMLQFLKDINKTEKRWNIKGFLDDNLAALDGYECDHRVVGRISDWQPSENEEFVCAVAFPKIKEKVVSCLKGKGARFVSVIHPTAYIGDFNKIGEGLVMFPHSYISVNTKIGDFVTLLYSHIGHDAEIGDYSTVCGQCGINGHVTIGKRVFVGSNVGTVPGVTIGDDTWIGAGSVVVSDIRPGVTVVGNPAKRELQPKN
ncbi:MAG: acetyltransferase [Clostridia bacterium]|nr:acetyltransferase [Clostridia bacterium]